MTIRRMITVEQKLYHGSDVVVKKPKADYKLYDKNGNEIEYTSDFGKGFYLGLNRGDAISWAVKKARKASVDKGRVSIFNLKKPLIPSSKVKFFSEPDEEWFDFICNCRRNRDTTNYDVVIGEVADANTNDLIVAYENNNTYKDRKTGEQVDFGKLSPEEKKVVVMRLIKFNKSFIQICFRSSGAIEDYLKYNGVEDFEVPRRGFRM